MKSLFLPDHDAFVRWHEMGKTGPAIVYLAGLGMPAVDNFLAVASHPALRETRALMIDLLGAGSSDRPATYAHTLENHAQCIAAVLDHLGTGPCTLVGYSMGGSISVALALARPDLVARLVVAEGNLIPGGGNASRHIAAQSEAEFTAKGLPGMLGELRTAALAGEEFKGFVHSAWSQVDPRGLYGNARMLVDLPLDFADRFLALEIPRWFVYGANNLSAASAAPSPDLPDPGVLKSRGVAIAVVAGVGHEMMLGNPDGFAEVLGAVINR